VQTGGPRRRRRPGMGRWWWCSQQLPALRDRWCRYFSVTADAGADFQLRIRSPSGGGGSSTQPAPRSQSGLRRRTFPSCEVPVCAAAEASIGLGMPVADGRRWVVEPGGGRRRRSWGPPRMKAVRGYVSILSLLFLGGGGWWAVPTRQSNAVDDAAAMRCGLLRDGWRGGGTRSRRKRRKG